MAVEGAILERYYILLDEARRTSLPRHQLLTDVTDNSWPLHREHNQAGRCIILQGPDPKQFYPATSWPELASALQGKLDYVETHLDAYRDFSILKLCRLTYGFDIGDVVVSKHAAAEWPYDAFRERRHHIEGARKSEGLPAILAKDLIVAPMGCYCSVAPCEYRGPIGLLTLGQVIEG